MSSGALFGNHNARVASKNLVEFKAGRMTMKGKMVYPDMRKGLLYVYQSDESLMHFCWKDRSTGVVEDDLIIFPDDCEFKHVPQCKTGRVYILRFKSSNKRFFFWLQDLKTDKDEENCRKVNEVLNNPPSLGSQRSSGANPEGDLQNLLNNMSQAQLMQLFGGVGQIGGLGNLLGTMTRPHGIQSAARPSTTVSTSASTQVTTSSPRPVLPQIPTPTATVAETAKSDAERVTQRGVASELTSAIPAAITATENLERAMSTHLPPGDNLCTTLSSPQFSQALSMFWSALQSGQAGPIVHQFDMGPEAVNAAASGNIEEFIAALETDAKVEQGQSQQGEDDKSKKQPSQTGSQDKKDDDDEGMALD